jgi:3-mercaptopyruvate sulfurtransferase SseA
MALELDGDESSQTNSLLYVCSYCGNVLFGGFSMRLIIAFFAVGVLAFAVSCNSAEWKNAKTAASAPAPAAAPPQADGVRRVTVNELKDLVAKNEAFVVDVRNEAAYNSGHIRGSKLIPEGDVANRSDELPKNKLIVTYCS